MTDVEYEADEFTALLRTWASATEHLLAFAPDKTVEWFERARGRAQDDALWPEEHRTVARDTARAGTLAPVMFDTGFHERVQAQQRALWEARKDLGDFEDE